MVQPGYLLNPGDMFQVEPERVLFATGANKDTLKYREAVKTPEQDTDDFEEVEELDCTVDSEGRLVDGSVKDQASSEAGAAEDSEEKRAAEVPSRKKALQVLQERAVALLNDPAKTVSAQRKRDLRAFKRTLRSTLSILSRTPDPDKTIGDMRAQLDALITRIQDDASGASGFGGARENIKDKTNNLRDTTATTNSSSPSSSSSSSSSSSQLTRERSNRNFSIFNDPDKPTRTSLAEALARIRENPPDPSKPYATPWRPRDYMSAFAFIPRYLEVNQKICSAVYLRHPVARPGLSEVPTPFHPETNQLAFTWYLRRR